MPAALLLGVARGSPFNGSKLLTRLGHRWFPSVKVRPRDLAGQRVSINTSDLGQLISYEEIMVDGCYNFQLVPFTPSVVLDCGAHVGFFTMLAGARFPHARLQAFEPNPDNLADLRRNLETLFPRAAVFDVAVSVEDGERWFHADFSNAGQLRDTVTEGSVRIKVLNLGPVIEAVGAGPLLLKLDVEGEEQRIIPSVVRRLPQRSAVFYETHDGLNGWQQLAEIFTDAAFSVRCLRERDPFYDGFALRE